MSERDGMKQYEKLCGTSGSYSCVETIHGGMHSLVDGDEVVHT